MNIASTWILYAGMIDSLKLKCLIVLTVIYFLLSVVCAKREVNYQFAILTNVLDNSLIPLYGGLVVIGTVAVVQPEWASFIPTVWGILNLMMFGLIAAKSKELGLPIPPLPWIGSTAK